MGVFRVSVGREGGHRYGNRKPTIISKHLPGGADDARPAP
jgi:hypothetical protein